MLPRVRSSIVLVSIAALLAGIALLGYARWSTPLLQAQTAADTGDSAGRAGGLPGQRHALHRHADRAAHPAARFSRAPPITSSPCSIARRYDDVIELAQKAPAGRGAAFLVRLRVLPEGDGRTSRKRGSAGLRRAEEEFSKAVEAAPDDWDTKYNFELTPGCRGASQAAQHSAEQLMQLLRPTNAGQPSRSAHRLACGSSGPSSRRGGRSCRSCSPLWLIQFLYSARPAAHAGAAALPSAVAALHLDARDAIVPGLAAIAGGALVFALVRPQAPLTTRTPQYEREDLVIMLDRSASMRAHDVAPSRFARATEEIRTFLKNKPENIDRVGLVGFAGSSLILSYLTRDLDNVAVLPGLDRRGSAEPDGHQHRRRAKNALEVARKDDRKTRKIFVLLSDGEDYGGEVNRQLAVYRQEGHHINTIGIGSDEEVPVPR